VTPFRNGEAISLDQVPRLEPAALVAALDDAIGGGERLAAFFALADSGDTPLLLALLADDAEGTLRWLGAAVPEKRYPALTATRPSAQAFEREIFEQAGILPEGHPWLKPLRRHPDLEGDVASAHPFFTVGGAGVHEVAVGPVHAGVIEPGHFRFQCHGEEVLSLEIQLGYQQRGVETLLAHAAAPRAIALAESIAGDTSVGHAIAHAMVAEALRGTSVPLRGEALRAIALELERLANHVGDLAGLSTDVAYLPGGAYFGRLRGDFLNLSMELAGSRFGRGLVVAGGVRFDLDEGAATRFRERLARAGRDLRETAELSLRRPSVESRFEKTGVVSRTIAEDLGLVGPVARASGSKRDVRRDHAHGFYRYAHIPVTMLETGDVMARAMVRWLEAERSLEFLDQELAGLPAGPIRVEPGVPRANAIATALVEGWRGEIVHVAVSDARGDVRRYKIVDPSFHNWLGLALALRGEGISDFPLCNKSFNLSYCGHDL
jgi:Ni,Fe-hydrogenase III large subunit